MTSLSIRPLLVGLVLCLTGNACAQNAPRTPEQVERWSDTSFFELETKTLEGEKAPLSKYDGKVVVVVNVASRCGFTPQYAGLEALWKEFKDDGLVVIAFPSNDFGGQEPGSAKEIREFCTSRYEVTFPVMEKVATKAGEKQSPVYEFLGTRTGKLPGWNFSKYVVGRDGKPLSFHASNVAPDSAAFRKAIKDALAAEA